MKTVLITGCSKGIGLEFARQYANAGWRVIATYREAPTEALERLQADADDLRLAECHVDSIEGIEKLAVSVADTPIDVLISNAGLMGRGGGPADQKGELFGSLDYELFDEYMATNVRGPAKLIERLVGNVSRSETRKIVVISSGAGSFGMPSPLPGSYWYKASKSALNMVVRNMAKDLKSFGISVVLFHPGLVMTERLEPMRERILSMSGQERPFETNQAVANMIATIERADPEGNARFVKNDGSEMPW